MSDSGIVIDTTLIAAAVPIESLTLLHDDNVAMWQERIWNVSWVPQRSWHYDGRLVAEPNTMGTSQSLTSSEDISTISRNVRMDAIATKEVRFRAENELEDTEKDLRIANEDGNV
ncbi:hypothetical protein IEI94_18930 [Halomonas sp. ML-15]|uniref:hypothetical protein n=1 Tax=Halomonas sp. ML-15 TaxID=2773305 RepID=UPI001745EC03|nr:hypothetical protein [Halomonas sp. ML-15]MBD3897936.1 hypothetical protein [Halomonas sp. ML-15]